MKRHAFCRTSAKHLLRHVKRLRKANAAFTARLDAQRFDLAAISAWERANDWRFKLMLMDARDKRIAEAKTA